MKRFIPLCYLCLVFFNSFVDLGHKILIQNVFYIAETPLKFTIFSAIVNAMILLPYLLMFSPAGFIADKFAKSSVLKVTAWAALPLTILITLFYFMGWFWLAFAMTLLLALQSAINSPAKYGYVKELFGQEKLAKANGYVQSLTVAAILLGTFLFSILFQHFLLGQTNDKAEIMQQIAPAGLLLIASSLLESIVSLFLPRFKVAAPKSQFRIKKWVSFSYLRSNLSSAAQAPGVLAAIIGLSVLWGVNQVVVAAYGAYLKEYVAGATPVFVQGVMACAIIGVVIGALYAGRVSRRFIETGTIPIAVIGMAIMLWLMVSVTSKPLIVAVFLIYGVFIGLFIVPLNALIQCNAPEKSLGKVLASNNFLQNVFMFVFLAGTVGLALEKLDAVVTFRVLFVISVLGGLYTIYRLPQSMIRYLVYALVSRFYRLEVFGLKNIPQQGGVLLMGNHTSYLDWAIIAMASPRPVRFVMDRGVYEKQLVHWLFKLICIIPISRAGSRQAITAIEEALNAGDVVCLFPEGYLSRTGQMGPFLKGYEKAVANTDAVIVPFYVHGLWGSAVSLATKAFKVFTKESKTAGQVLVGFGEPLTKSTPAAELKQAVVKLSNHLWETYAQHMESIPQTWLRRAKKLGRHISMRDAKGAALSGYQSIAAVMLMKKALRQQIGDQQHVGVLLPASVGGALANLALMALGKTVVNINYTASPEAIAHILKTAEIETVVTAEVFLKRLEARGIDVSGLINQTHCIALEDVRAGISRVERVVQGIMAMVLPQKLLRLGFKRVSPDDTAVLLFSSGSEDLPKGVELSHRNVVINAMQSASILNPQGMDKILGSLPPFHAFGLTVTLLMPLIFGAEVVFSPDPTDAVGIAKAVAKYDLTVLCGTATFVNLYARHPRVHPLMFASLRLVIVGAEKLTEGVASNFKAKFGVDIMQGYGATETAPVASFNVPDMLVKEDFHVQVGNHPGTVGQAVPGTQLKIVDPESYAPLPIGEAGMLLVAGPQIMKGYFKAPEKTAAAIIEQDGQRWYVTGDKAQLDANGVLTILDRYSRFAKIAGEMVSLMAVETEVSRILAMENTDVAVLAVGDEKKGEQLVLFLARKATQEGVLAELRQGKLLSLWLPKTVISLEDIPKLGSGKTDYVALKGLVDI